MITAIVLCHPQSVELLNYDVFNNNLVQYHRISCGTTKCPRSLSESNDFFPTYASLNSILFESSVILTVWEHADDIIGKNDVAFMHTDIVPNISLPNVWEGLSKLVADGNTVGITMPSSHTGLYNELVVNASQYVPKNDPYMLHEFDNNINVWEFIKKYDRDIYDWSMDTQPILIYSHQFMCSRAAFDKLGYRLYEMVQQLNLGDCGLWTPHMFERLIALYLARENNPIVTSAFWHNASSGIVGPGEQCLYGPRPFRYYRISKRYLQTVAN